METISCPIDHMPVFVRDGTLLPLMEPCDRMPGTPVPVTITAYGNTEGIRASLYEDDGTTYTYEKGVYQWIQLSMKKGKLQIQRNGKRQLWSSISLASPAFFPLV